ncbi:MAG TPA: A/G-specific adenine glycosylase [Chloroflexota bacterium]|nr:A/G-specific adenine glycosylase [Chloroflexota bacterium]
MEDSGDLGRSRAAATPDLQRAVLDWYASNRRDLPWRRTPSPYRTLVSEIMLQQTQVDRVRSAFESFVERFPTFEALGRAERSDVVRAWAGLGYNRRAVHLHELARVVVERYGGCLPADYGSLTRLPGIGRYTAGAILSIVYGQDVPALDTNVRRVITRACFSPTVAARPRDLAEMARDLVPEGRASDWNQALMDLGATVCLSRRPRCLICPIRRWCSSAGRVASGPRSPGKQPPFASSMRYYRGRLLDELRALPAGAVAPLPHIASRLAAAGVAEPPAGWETVSRNLARDGLVRIDEGPEALELGLA